MPSYIPILFFEKKRILFSLFEEKDGYVAGINPCRIYASYIPILIFEKSTSLFEEKDGYVAGINPCRIYASYIPHPFSSKSALFSKKRMGM